MKKNMNINLAGQYGSSDIYAPKFVDYDFDSNKHPHQFSKNINQRNTEMHNAKNTQGNIVSNNGSHFTIKNRNGSVNTKTVKTSIGANPQKNKAKRNSTVTFVNSHPLDHISKNLD